MANGNSIKAGHITTAYSTTDLVAEQKRRIEGLAVKILGSVIFRVGPTNNNTNGLSPTGPWTAFRVREIAAVRVWWA